MPMRRARARNRNRRIEAKALQLEVACIRPGLQALALDLAFHPEIERWFRLRLRLRARARAREAGDIG